MKKLLVLALVLGMATMANAALVVTLDGPTSLVYGETGTYTIGYTDEGGIGICGIDIDLTPDMGTITGGAVVASNRVTSYDWAAKNTGSPNFELVAVNDGPAMIGSPLFTFDLQAPMSGSQINLAMLLNSCYDSEFGDATPDMPSMVVTLVPEPMTMVLLGLGGLFLRRRK